MSSLSIRPGFWRSIAAGAFAAVVLLLCLVPPTDARLAVKRTDGPRLEEIVIQPAHLNLGPGESGQMTATGVYEDGSSRDLTQEVVWTSRDDEIATVSSAGFVSAVAPGETEIEAEEPVSEHSSDNGGEVVVAAIEALSIVPSSAILTIGQAVQLVALAELSDGRTGFDATSFVRWTTGESSVATVSDQSGSKGLVTAQGLGETPIRAKDLESGEQTDNDEGVITVVAVPPATPTPAATATTPTPPPAPTPTPGPRIEIVRIDLEPLAVALLSGDSTTIRAVATLEDGSQRDVTGEMIFESGKERVAVVAAGGVVTALEAGKAKIDAYHPASGRDVEDRSEIWVGKVDEVELLPSTANLVIGETIQLAAAANYNNGLSKDITAIAQWSSEKTRVATVSDVGATKGLVTAVARGDATIFATDPDSGKKSSAGRVVVAEPSPTPTPVPTANPATPTPTSVTTPNPLEEIDEINLEPLTVKLLAGEVAEIRAIATLKNGSQRDVTAEMIFESDKERIATVDHEGFVTAVGAGKTKIDATHPESNEDARKKVTAWVGKVETIGISPSRPELLIGDTLALSALATHDNGLSEDITAVAEWSSEKTRVAIVSNAGGSKGIVTGIARGDAVIVARDAVSGKKSKGSSGRVTVIEEGVPDPGDIGDDGSYSIGLRQIVLDPQSLNLMPGETGFITATGLYADSSTRDLTPHVEFKSRRKKVATVDESGTVMGRRGGDTLIRVEEPITGIHSRVPSRIHVAEMTSIEILPPERLVGEGQTLQLQAMAHFDNLVSQDVTDEVKWSSSRRSVAEVVSEGPNPGLVSGVSAGQTEISVQHLISRVKTKRRDGVLVVTTEPQPEATPVATPAPTPSPDPLGPVYVIGQLYEPEVMVLQEDETAQILTWLLFSDDSQQLVVDGLDYDTSDIRVASVSDEGTVLARGAGVATIQVADAANGFAGEVTVVVREITSLRISPASSALRVGVSDDLEAFASFSDGTNDVDVTAQVGWKSSDSVIVSVDEGGRITSHAPGAVVIEVMDPVSRVRSDSSTGIVTVLGDPVRLYVTPVTLALRVGEERNYKAFGVFDDGSTARLQSDIQWSIDGGLPPLATISESGRVTAIDLGDATVHATDIVTGISSADDGSSALVSVVGDIIGIKISTKKDINVDSSDVILGAGQTKSLRGLCQFAGRTEGFDFADSLDWYSTNPAAVSVNDGGLVACHSVGVAIISAVDPETGVGSTETLGDLPVTCGGQVLALRTHPDFRDLDYLDTRQLRAYRILEDGSETEVTRKVLWTSTDPDIVSIVETGDQGGLAMALGDGQAILYAYDSDFDVSSADSGQISVLRTRKTRTLLEIFPQDDDVGFTGAVGEIFGFQARVTYASGATQGVNTRLTWSSSDPSILTIGDDSGGLKVNQATLVAPGTVTVTGIYPPDAASAGELQVSATFTVTP